MKRYVFFVVEIVICLLCAIFIYSILESLDGSNSYYVCQFFVYFFCFVLVSVGIWLDIFEFKRKK